MKIFFIFAAVYMILQLGRWWGQTEVNKPQIVKVYVDGQVGTYNEIMLKNCLLKLKTYEK